MVWFDFKTVKDNPYGHKSTFSKLRFRFNSTGWSLSILKKFISMLITLSMLSIISLSDQLHLYTNIKINYKHTFNGHVTICLSLENFRTMNSWHIILGMVLEFIVTCKGRGNVTIQFLYFLYILSLKCVKITSPGGVNFLSY